MEGKGGKGRFTWINLILAVLIVLAAGVWGAGAGMMNRDRGGGGQAAQEESGAAPAEPYERQSPIEVCRLDGVAYEIPLSGTAPAPSSSEAPSSAAAPQPAADGSFVLPESNTRYYSRGELEGLDRQQLYLARNEIYARLGRKFKNPDLDRYFRSKSWYQPLYEADSFDAKGDGVFNQYELANRNLIVEIENGMR